MNIQALLPEHRQQLATLLAYCREMGGFDFYRSPEEPDSSKDAAVAPISSGLQVPVEAVQESRAGEAADAIHSQAISRDSHPTEIPPIMPPRSTPSIPTDPMDYAKADLAPAQRAAALQAIQTEIGDCTRCPLAFEGRNKIVFGDGDPNAELLFVGEGPGADEDMQGLPFVGRGGQLLNNMIAAMGLRRDQVYIANIVKCRPPKNRVPEPIEAQTCTPFLFQQIGVVRPKLIVALGATAATYLTGSKAALSILRGQIHDCLGTKLVVTYHPAYLLRDPRQKGEAWKDLQLAMKFLKLSPPKKDSK